MWLGFTSFILARNDALHNDGLVRTTWTSLHNDGHFDGDIFAPSLALLNGPAPPLAESAFDADKERLPLVFVTGLLGTVLDGKYTNREGSWLCPRNAPWHRVWPPAAEETKPWNLACIFNNLRETWDPATGNYTEFVRGVEIQADLSPDGSVIIVV